MKSPPNELPDDYEPCGICGWDHQYEPESAYRWHQCYDDNGEELVKDVTPQLELHPPHVLSAIYGSKR